MILAEQTLGVPPVLDPRLESLSERKDQLERDAQQYAREVQEAVRGHLGYLSQFEEQCKLLWRDALAGKADEVQKKRELFLDTFLHRLILLNKAHTMARHAERLAMYDLPEAKQLETEAEALGGKLAQLTDRWKTVEDLEGLAAETIELPAGKLDSVRRKYPAPQAWYDQVGDPS